LKIWTYRKAQRPFCSSLRNASVEKNFYSEEDERFLANQIEGPATIALDKIRRRESITPDEKKRVTAYLVNLMARVPYSKIRVAAIRPKIVSRIFSEENIKINYTGGRELSAKETEELHDLRRQYENEEKMGVDELWSKMLPPHQFKKSLVALETMTWQFLTFDANPAFVTSDNPFFFFAHIGIGNTLSEVTLPISQNVALWATWNKEITPGFIPITKEIVVEINRRTVSKATRDIYSPVQAYWVTKLAERRRYRRNRIVAIDGSQHYLQPF
jgi:hypothetical protein